MEVARALMADLAVLTAALEDPDADLVTLVDQLGVSAAVAVNSFLGLRLTLIVDGYPFIMSTVEGDPVCATSARVPLPAADGTDAGSEIVFHAATPGALVDLAADVTYRLGLRSGEVVLDADLAPGGTAAASTGLADISTLNQAVGVLIDRGRTPQLARAQLDATAREAGLAPLSVAREILRRPRPPDPLPESTPVTG